MFGGHGLFHEDKMFCIVDSQGKAFLKAHESLNAEYKKAGASKHSKMPYYSVPKEIIDSQKKLVAWAKKSIDTTK